MLFRWLADLTVLLHAGFVIFVVAGGLLALRWPRIMWIHLPAALWGIVVEWAGLLCPLTPLENWLRRRGGSAGYGGGFIEHYVLPVVYPESLTRGTQLILGVGVLVANVVIYWHVLRSRRRGENRGPRAT